MVEEEQLPRGVKTKQTDRQTDISEMERWVKIRSKEERKKLLHPAAAAAGFRTNFHVCLVAVNAGTRKDQSWIRKLERVFKFNLGFFQRRRRRISN